MKRSALALGLVLLLPCLAAVTNIDKAKSIGKPNAPIVVEIFASFDCPHCKALHEEMVPLLMRDFVNPGKVYLVNREFPLSGQFHPWARDASNFVVAAARIGKYPQAVEAVFKTQATWIAVPAFGKPNDELWKAVASVLTRDEQQKVLALAKDPNVTGEVQREYDLGVALGVNSTPSIFVTHGSQRFPVPAQQLNYAFLKSMLDGMK